MVFQKEKICFDMFGCLETGSHAHVGVRFGLVWQNIAGDRHLSRGEGVG